MYPNRTGWHRVLCKDTGQFVSQADPRALAHQQNFSSIAAAGWSSSVPSPEVTLLWHPQPSSRCNIPMAFLAGVVPWSILVPGSFIQARANAFVLGENLCDSFAFS